MDVQFNEPEYTTTTAASPTKRGPLMRFIIGRGWAKNEAGAERVLLYVMGVVIAITAMVWLSQINFSAQPPLIPADPGVGTP